MYLCQVSMLGTFLFIILVGSRYGFISWNVSASQRRLFRLAIRRVDGHARQGGQRSAPSQPVIVAIRKWKIRYEPPRWHRDSTAEALGSLRIAHYERQCFVPVAISPAYQDHSQGNDGGNSRSEDHKRRSPVCEKIDEAGIVVVP